MDAWMMQFDGIMLYWVLFGALLGGAIGLPLPEDLILIVGGLLAHQGRLELGWVFVFCYLGIILGDLIIYFIGRTFGATLFQKEWFQKRISRRRLRKTRVRLERKSFPMIFFARHVPYLRTITFLTCGAVKMKPLTFILSDSLSALVSAPIMIGLGYFASESFDAVTSSVNMFYRALFVLTVAGILIFAAFKYKERKRKQNLEKAEIQRELNSSAAEGVTKA